MVVGGYVMTQRVFEQLKQILTTAPILGTSNFSQEFVIERGASGRGIGTILMQSG